jgi:hypothetical protein
MEEFKFSSDEKAIYYLFSNLARKKRDPCFGSLPK